MDSRIRVRSSPAFSRSVQNCRPDAACPSPAGRWRKSTYHCSTMRSFASPSAACAADGRPTTASAATAAAATVLLILMTHPCVLRAIRDVVVAHST